MAKRILTGLRLDKIAAVDRPCQEGATMTIMKRAEDPLAADIAKRFIDPADGARPFAEFLAERLKSKQFHAVQEELWPLFNSMQDAVTSIMGDTSVPADQRSAMVRSSVEDFLNAVRSKVPTVEAELAKLITAGEPAGDHVSKGKDSHMPDAIKTVADLKKQVADLKLEDSVQKAVDSILDFAAKAETRAAAAEAFAKMSDKEKDHMKDMDEDAKKAFMALSADDRAKAVAKKAENDEVLKVDGTEIRKSEVGAAQFAVMKSQQDRIAKQDEEIRKERDERVMTELRKRADDEFEHVAGSTDERASMLKALSDMKDETVRKAFEAVFKQAEEMGKHAFDTLGHRHGDTSIAKAASDFEATVTKFEDGGKVSKIEALRKARKADPEGFKAYNERAA